MPLTEFRHFLRAFRDRVWYAVGDARQFGIWFGAELDGPFAAGARLTGRIVPTKVHPGLGRAPIAEPETLVSFEIADAAGGTTLTVTESGVSRCLWPPREMALLVEKFLAGAVDLRRGNP